MASSDERRGSVPTTVEENDAATAGPVTKVETEYPAFPKLIVIMLSLYMTMFIVALDRTIIGTAIPSITDEFNSIQDVGWYSSAFLLTSSAFVLIFGRVYTFYNPKWVLLVAIAIFEVGSIVCAAAPSSVAFIIGRAIAGLGGAGIFSGVINIMIISVPLHKRPVYQGLFGAVFGISSVVGPLLGGVFTTEVTWRWCFWINLPIGGVVMVILLFLIKGTPSTNTDTWKEKIWRLDPWGTLCFLPGIICLLLALQWGGTTYNWGNARIIVLFILAGVLLGLFIFIQFKMGDNATVPIRIIKQRSVAAGAYFSFVNPGGMFILVYWLPVYFQAIKGVTAVRSGIDTIPLVLSLVVGTVGSGVLTSKTGYYVPPMLAGSVFTSIGAGLLSTLQVDTPSPRWIGYQILFGFGLGLGLQQANLAAQTCLAKKDVMIGVSVMMFMQGLGGSIFAIAAQQVFDSSLQSKLSGIAGLDAHEIVNTGGTSLRSKVPAADLPQVLFEYNSAISNTIKVAIGCAAAGILGGLFMEWKSVKKGAKNANNTSVAAESNAVGAASAAHDEENALGASEKGPEGAESALNEDSPRTSVGEKSKHEYS